jgi:hypothetical protein
MGAGICWLFIIVFALAAFLIQVVLPLYLLIKVILWITRYFTKGEVPWHKEPAQGGGLKEALARDKAAAQSPADKVAGLEAALADAKNEAAVLAAAAANARRIEEEASRKREELAATMKAQGRLDKLALAYYVEASLREGCEAGAIKAALRAKGWPEADIDGAFLACGAEPA